MVNEPGQFPEHQTNNSKGHGQISPMGEKKERVTIASLGDGSFDPYGTYFNLSHVTTLLIDSNDSSMDVDAQGSNGTEGITRVKDKDIKVGDRTQPSATPFGDVAQSTDETINDVEVFDQGTQLNDLPLQTPLSPPANDDTMQDDS